MDSTVKNVLAKEPQVSFRIQTWRHQRGLDVNRARHCDAVRNAVAVASRNYKEAGDTEVKQLQSMQTQPTSTSIRACKFWGTTTGCLRGAKCKFAHAWDGIEDKAARCWECSSLEHRKNTCPTLAEKSDKSVEGKKDGKRDGAKAKGKGKTHGDNLPRRKSRHGRDR